MKRLLVVALLLCTTYFIQAQTRMLVIGAHPDDCELLVGGTAAKVIESGGTVKFVSMTNGNKGHHIYTPDEIKEVRYKEVQEVKRRLGCEYDIIDNNDGELMATLENRNVVIQLIRDFKADVVITHPPYDYHPDHRRTSTLVQDAAFMVTVPHVLPEVPYLRNNPVFLYTGSRYVNPMNPNPEIAVDITDLVDHKGYIVDAHVSQLYEWLPWINQDKRPIPQTKEERKTYMHNYILNRNKVMDHMKPAIKKWYGKEAKKVKAVEIFEICEFGRKVNDEVIVELFPFLK